MHSPRPFVIEMVRDLRAAFWPHLLPVAREWAGDALVFTTRDRPIGTGRGWSAAPMRHGLSTVRSGRRHALGLVFHDAT